MKSLNLIKKIISDIQQKNLQSHAAALAFFGLFSLGPIIFIILLLLTPTGINAGIKDNLPEELNATTNLNIEPLAETTNISPIIAIIIGAAIIIFGATKLFDELIRSLNTVFYVNYRKKSFLKKLKKKGLSILILILLAAIIIFSTGISSAITNISDILNLNEFIILIITAITNFILLIIFLSLLYRTLPDCKLSGKQVIKGTIASSILVMIGQALIALYINNIDLAATYGATSTTILILLWAYYTAFAFLIGAEISYLYTYKYKNAKN